MKRLFVLAKIYLPVVLPALLLVLLLLRNPFSERTLISNFEPFPDSFHYVTSARCWLAGEGWQLCRQGRYITPSVPPLYSAFLIPFLATSADPRIFYFANVLLAGVSLFSLYVLLNKLKMIWSIQLLTLLLYVTNYYVYWLPNLAMAENLLLTTFLLGLNVLTLQKSWRKTVLIGLLTVGFYHIKFAAAPLSLGFFVLGIVDILTGQGLKKTPLRRLIIFLALIASGFLILSGDRFFSLLSGFVENMALSAGVESETLHIVNEPGVKNDWFSFKYFPQNFTLYLKMLIGKNTVFLWETRALIQNWLGVVGILGLLGSLVFPKLKKIARTILFLALLQIVFIANFYTVDARYIIILFPSLLLGFAFTLQFGLDFLSKKINRKILISCILAGCAASILLRFSAVKYQIAVNLKYAETPWWYVAIKQADSFFSQPQFVGQNPVLVTAISPYLIDFYSQDKFQVLPLTEHHDFQSQKNELYGNYDFSNLTALYAKLLAENRSVYVTNYGLGNEIDKQADYDSFAAHFHLELVQEGCYGICNIYKVTPLKLSGNQL